MNRVMTPTTSSGEKARSLGVEQQKTAQSHTEMNWSEGRVKAADQKRRVIKVGEPKTGNDLFGGRWIPLAHSVHEIVDRFGKIRKGMEVFVLYRGKAGAPTSAYAWIIGEEDESGPNKDLAENNMAQGFHNILMENL